MRITVAQECQAMWDTQQCASMNKHACDLLLTATKMLFLTCCYVVIRVYRAAPMVSGDIYEISSCFAIF
jgi:hypothetical protein